MKKMYKDGKTCMAGLDQIEIMKGAGWSSEKPKEAQKVVETLGKEKAEAIEEEKEMTAAQKLAAKQKPNLNSKTY